MSDKFEYYDLLGILVPGSLLIAWIPVCFPAVSELAVPGFPEAFGVVLCTAVAVFLGQMVQAVASLTEPLLHRSWGGRPSDLALAGTLPKYLPQDSSERIKRRLAEAMGGESSERSVFLYAMQLTDGAGIGRAPRFNSLYAYHRGLLTTLGLGLILFVCSMLWGAASKWTLGQCVGVFLGLGVLFALVWYRTKQRGCYYAREVLLCAERVAQSPAKSPKE
jgi:hypothetical protein